MIELSASQAPRARACPPSIRTEGLQVVTGDLPAAGLALHHMMMSAIANHQHPEVAHVAAMFHADPEELERLAIQGWRAWSAIRQWFGDFPQCEMFLEKQFGELRLSGHVDVLGFANAQGQIRIADWKTSWQSEEEYEDQIRAYALLALESYPHCVEVWAAIIRPRQGTYDAKVYRREELDAWLKGIMERLTGRGSEHYHVGEQCLRCPRAAQCPAITALLRQAGHAIDVEVMREEPEVYQEIHTNIRILEHQCEAARKALKAKVAAAGGRIGNLVLTEEKRETIRYTKDTQAIMAAELPLEEQWEEILKVAKTELKKAVMAQASRGEKMTRWDAVQTKLREAGAVDKTFITKLELRRSHADESSSDSEHATIPAPCDGSQTSD